MKRGEERKGGERKKKGKRESGENGAGGRVRGCGYLAFL